MLVKFFLNEAGVSFVLDTVIVVSSFPWLETSGRGACPSAAVAAVEVVVSAAAGVLPQAAGAVANASAAAHNVQVMFFPKCVALATVLLPESTSFRSAF